MRRINLCTVLSLALAGCTVGCGEPSSSSSVQAHDTTVVKRTLRPGDVHHYDFNWTVSSTTERGMLGQAPVQAGVELAGELQLRVLAQADDGTTLGVKFARLSSRKIELFGQDILPDATALEDHEAVIFVPADGDARRVLFDPRSPSVFRHLMSGLLGHFDLRLPSGDGRWTAVAPTGNGLARVEYAAGEDEHTYTRRIERYLRVDAVQGLEHEPGWHSDGQGSIVLGEDGMPTALEADEVLVLSRREEPLGYDGRTHVRLTRTSIEPGPVGALPELSDWIEHDLHDPPDDEEAQREMARRFAEGLTMTDLAIVVRSAGHGLRPPPGFMVRARGLLRGWPELAVQLVELFDEAPDHRTRAFVLDLLVSADTPQAQEAIAELLGRHPRVENVPGLLQHLVLLRTPTAETAKLLLDLHAAGRTEGDDVLRQAALYPMGSVAAGISHTDPELGQLLLSTIRDDLGAARTADDRMAGLAALGNAGFAEDLPRILVHTSESDPQVRTVAVNALRHYDGPGADAALFDAIDDEDRLVGAMALTVIEGYRPSEAAIDRLARQVTTGEHHPELVGPIVNVLAKRALNRDSANEALQALSQRTDDPRQLRRIRRLLGEA